ncbi:unnamed protein product [Danaus chrysippus]|uniref:(African queen) hypothetical protein n=1 Tax=Danaus chrysippus TaxID=151541 RepID=A0A8J2QYL9_9NEOP|nr:unnamed protein product [Danaus chrysippus]
MISGLYVRMLYILVLCPALLASSVLTLSIDSQLGTSIEDCFERISIGDQLPHDSIYRNVSELMIKECEQICKQDKQCQAFDYGVGAKGNATCDLSNINEKEIKEKNLLQRNSDYDVYIRRILCDPAPPTPIEEHLNENDKPPLHRPVIRPQEDDRKPFDNPFESSRPLPSYSNRPNANYNQINDRPDGYSPEKPDYDRPPSYGGHKPPELPYRPSRPNNSRPDAYDELYFQDNRRPRPDYWRPDPYHPVQPDDDIEDMYRPKPSRPQRPQYTTEKPHYQYIIRPSKNPHTPIGHGYRPDPDYPTRPGPYGPIPEPSRPIGPPNEYRPTRPYDKPVHTYTDQYASNYGNQDNSVFVEIYDPPRPSRPHVNERPYYGTNYGTSSQSYGQNSYSSQHSYSQNQAHYGTSAWNENYHYGQRPAKPSSQDYGYKPEKPDPSGYNEPNEDTGYGSRPTKKPTPTENNNQYGQSFNQNYGEAQSNNAYSNQGSSSNQGYGSSSNQGYGSSSNQGYGSSSNQGYGSSSNQGYGSSSNQGYGSSSNQGYGSSSNQGYGSSSNQGYGSSSNQGYGSSSNQGYGSSSNQGYGSSSNQGYGSSSNQGYGSSSNQGYGSSSNQGYGSSTNQDNYNQVSNGYENRPTKDRPQSGLQNGFVYQISAGHNQVDAAQSSSYGQSSQEHATNQYGNQVGSVNQVSNKPQPNGNGYGEQPITNKPILNNNYGQGDQNHGDYGQSVTQAAQSMQYGSSQTSTSQQYANSQSGYNSQSIASYGQAYGQTGYYGSHLGYGIHHLYGIKPGSYGNTDARPSSDGSSNVGYGKKEDRPSNKPAIRPVYDDPDDKHSRRPGSDRPLLKPQGSERERPGFMLRPNDEIITSRPVAVSDIGRRPENDFNYEACFRRVLAGKRAVRSHVRRVVDCERLEDCRRECANEKRFPCESFNYRLDPSFRGKGLCELMTKPIEAFDLRQDFVEDKDYDFYEVDRNSLEPYCPETLRGPGLLHSGYLSSRNQKVTSQNQWRDRNWSAHDYRTNNRFYNEKKTSNTRYEQPYIPYQIGISRTDDEKDSWGKYGGSYGVDNYYKDRNDYHKSISHWGLRENSEEYHREENYNSLRRQHEQEFDYNSLRHVDEHLEHGDQHLEYGYGTWKKGRWNNSGSFWRDDTPTKIEYDEDDNVKDCSSRRRPGMSLGVGAVRRSLAARTVVDCETACFGERNFKCVSYSYRYSSPPGSDNCFLSERPYKGLEMSADSSSDVYAMPLHHDCLTISTKPWVESECFWHVRSGAALSRASVRSSLTVSGLGACEAECIRAHGFFCRGFSFRFDPPTIGDDLENCLLTSSPPTTLDLSRGLTPNKHELYSRGNYGRGCEPALYDDAEHEPQCYLQYVQSARLTRGAVRGRARTSDERACGRACTDAPFRCLSFSYTSNAPPDTDNCLLSEIRLFDLHRGVDYEHSADDLLFAFDLFNGQCWRKIHGKHDYEVPTLEVPHPIQTEENYPLSGPDAPPSETYISSGPSGPPAHKPYIIETDFKPGSKPYLESGESDRPFEYPEPGYKPYNKPYRPDYEPDKHDGYRPRPSGPDLKPPYAPNPSYDGPSISHSSGTLISQSGGASYGSSSNFAGSSSYGGHESHVGSDHSSSAYGGSASNSNYGSASNSGYGSSINSNYGSSSGTGYGSSSNSNYGSSSGSGYGSSSNSHYGSASGSGYSSLSNSNYGASTGTGYGSSSYSNYGSSSGSGYDSSSNSHYGSVSGSGYGSSSNLNHGSSSGASYGSVSGSSHHSGGSSYGTSSGSAYGSTAGSAYGSSGGFAGARPNPVPSGHRPPRPVRPGDRVDDNLSLSWRHYTVSGFPCRRGTSCERNLVAGHWACEPEGGEIGSWDYCCAPSHRCGYSEGFKKPWCYVGPASDQWRPCSEKYYPYHQHNVPHPSQGQRDTDRPQINIPPRQKYPERDRLSSGYLSSADRRYWDDLYENGPQAYYDKYGNPLPGFSKVPTESRPHIKYERNPPRRGSGQWVPVNTIPDDEVPPPGLGVPRYWPVAYLHKGPPPNMTYFKYNETERTTRSPQEQQTTTNRANINQIEARSGENPRTEKRINITNDDSDYLDVTTTKTVVNETKENTTEREIKNETDVEEYRMNSKINEDYIKGIDGKLHDFTTSLEVFDIDDVKNEKLTGLRAAEAEEKQIEAIGRLLAARRAKIIDRTSQKNLEDKNIALDKDFMDFNFGNKFPIERRGVVQRVTKDEIENRDKSLEVSETSFIRPPRVLSTTENIRKAVVNGKVYYDASLRSQRDLHTNSTRRSKNLREIRTLPTKKRTRTTNLVRRAKRVYRKRYNPEEVRRRLLERERNKNMKDE